MSPHVGRGHTIADPTLTAILAEVARGKSIVLAAALCGYNDRTVYRTARKNPEFKARLDAARQIGSSRRLLACGTRAAYRRGCHCVACRVANARATREHRQRVAA